MGNAIECKENRFLRDMTYEQVANLFIEMYQRDITPVDKAYLFGNSLEYLVDRYDFEHDIDIMILKKNPNRSYADSLAAKRMFPIFDGVVHCIEKELSQEFGPFKQLV